MKKKKKVLVIPNPKTLPGFTIKWRDENPLSESPVITNQVVTHKNMVWRAVAMQTWRRFHDWILSSELTWSVVVKVIYLTPNKTSAKAKVDEGEFTITAPFQRKGDSRLADAVEAFVTESRLANSMLPDDHKNKGVYQHCDYEITILAVPAGATKAPRITEETV